MNELLALGESHPWIWPLVIVLSSFVLEDPTTLAVGVLIGQGKISPTLGYASVILGVCLGDLGLYGLGKLIKRGLWKSERRVFLDPSLLSIALARFVPGMRTLTFLSAGFNGHSLRRFIAVNFLTVILWTVLILHFTQTVVMWLEAYPRWVGWVLGPVILVLIQLLERRFKKAEA